jgi:hypothetical protein
MSENIGLFVYGGLLMALSFAVGLTMGDTPTTTLALAACATAALSHAIIEVVTGFDRYFQRSGLRRLIVTVSLASWFITAAAFVSALIALT